LIINSPLLSRRQRRSVSFWPFDTSFLMGDRYDRAHVIFAMSRCVMQKHMNLRKFVSDGATVHGDQKVRVRISFLAHSVGAWVECVGPRSGLAQPTLEFNNSPIGEQRNPRLPARLTQNAAHIGCAVLGKITQ